MKLIKKIFKFIGKLFKGNGEPDFQVGELGIYLKPVGSHDTNPFNERR